MVRALHLKVFVAGRVGIDDGGETPAEDHLPGRQGRLLFAYLVTEQGRAVPRDELAEALWGETPPATADKAIAVVVSKLRGLLARGGVDGAQALTGAFGCYRLELPEGTWVDVVAAGEAVEQAERALSAGDLDTAKAEAREAESLLRRPFLPGEEAAWVEEKRREYADVRLRALAVLAEACERSGDPAQAARWAEQAIELAPFREAGYRRLMEAHVAAGNRAEALRVYERCRRLLADELGTYPSPETETMYRALLSAPSFAEPPEAEPPAPPELPPARPTRPRRRIFVGAVVVAALVAAAAAAALSSRGGGVALKAGSLVKIDAATGKITDDVVVGPSPGEVVRVGGWIFVTSMLDGSLYRISRTTDAVTSWGRLSAGRSVARANDARLWVASAHDAVVRLVSADSFVSYPLETISLSARQVPGDVVRLPAVTVGGGSVWVADISNEQVARWRLRPFATPLLVHRYKLAPTDWTLGASFGGGAAWFGLGDPADAVLRIDARTGQAARFPVGRWPTKPTFGFGSVWVPMFRDDTVWRLDPWTGRPRAIVKVGHRPWSVSMGRDAVWVSDHCDGTVEEIDPVTNRVVRTIHTGHHPQWLTAAGGFVWVGLTGNLGNNVMGCEPIA